MATTVLELLTPPARRDDACELKPLDPNGSIYESIIELNDGFCSMHGSLTSLKQIFDDYIRPVVFLYEQYGDIINETKLIFENLESEPLDFLTITKANSSAWLQPLTIFYPTIFDEPFSDNNIEIINSWLSKFFPIKNEDGTLNYVEGQKYIVNCYTRNNIITLDVLDQPSSFCNCETQSGLLSLHCKTVITGGWIHCNQGSFNCNTTKNCHPSKNVDCWYETPYIRRNNLPINSNDPITAKQTARSRIQANIKMSYSETREVGVKTLIFSVLNCNWVYRGINLNL